MLTLARRLMWGRFELPGRRGFSPEVQKIAHMDPGDRLTSSRISNSLQRLRKRFQKEQRVLAQVSIAEQTYRPEKNAVDFTFQIDTVRWS